MAHPARREPGRSRIQREADSEQALSEGLAAAIAGQVAPEIVMTGRTIVAMRSEGNPLTGNQNITLVLDNGDAVSFIGVFQVAAERGKPHIGHSTKVPEIGQGDETVDGEVVEEADWEPKDA